MLVNAATFPGPALWQGLMLCAMPLALWGMFHNDGKYMEWAIGGYGAFGVLLMAAILVA